MVIWWLWDAGTLHCVGAMCSLMIDLINLWSVQHSAPHMAWVILTSWISLYLTITKSIRWHYLDLGCIQVVLYLSAWWKMVMAMHSMCSAHLLRMTRLLLFRFPMPWGSRTPFQSLLTLLTLTLKSPKIMSWSLGGVAFKRQGPHRTALWLHLDWWWWGHKHWWELYDESCSVGSITLWGAHWFQLVGKGSPSSDCFWWQAPLHSVCLHLQVSFTRRRCSHLQPPSAYPHQHVLFHSMQQYWCDTEPASLW